MNNCGTGAEKDIVSFPLDSSLTLAMTKFV